MGCLQWGHKSRLEFQNKWGYALRIWLLRGGHVRFVMLMTCRCYEYGGEQISDNMLPHSSAQLVYPRRAGHPSSAYVDSKQVRLCWECSGS